MYNDVEGSRKISRPKVLEVLHHPKVYKAGKQSLRVISKRTSESVKGSVAFK
jgi:hypothetical protein